MELHPFNALRPPTEHSAKVASPPYDVVSTEEARAFAEGNPAAVLHVTRPDITLADGVDIHSAAAYEEASRHFQRLQAEGFLVRDKTPALWAYRQVMNGRAQVGIVGLANVDDYDEGHIKKHEFTRPDKEDDRTRHVDTVGAHTGPVFLACRSSEVLNEMIVSWTSGEADFDFVDWADVQHTLWRISDPVELERSRSVYKEIEAFYVADGHHRAASASRVRKMRRERSGNSNPDNAWERFLVVVFPDEHLKILAYNRVVADLNGHSPESFLKAVEQAFEVGPVGADPVPTGRHNFAMYLKGQWHQLRAKDSVVEEGDPVARLDVAVLQNHLLDPVLGIDNPRTNNRIRFVGGIRGTGELERLVREGDHQGVAFSMYPTAISELFSVADANTVMPPKSTWFEPKLASGLIVNPLD
jgi:uncharacterized protein (DUF1015 family)